MKVYGRKETDPERLRLLEAVAEAARADMRSRYGIGLLSFTEYLALYPDWIERQKVQAVFEALAALEEYSG